MLCGSEYWAVDRKNDERTLRRMCGVTGKDIKNEYVFRNNVDE